MQAYDRAVGSRSAKSDLLSVALLLAALPALGACGARGIGLDDIAADRSIITGSVEKQPEIPADQVSDEATMRNAVSSVNIEQMGGKPIFWANPETGSRGAISEIIEYSEKGVTCRSFTASRESFRGVALYKGDACLGAGGNWWMRDFRTS